MSPTKLAEVTSAAAPPPVAEKAVSLKTAAGVPAKTSAPSAPDPTAAGSNAAATTAAAGDGNAVPQPTAAAKQDTSAALTDAVGADKTDGAPSTTAAPPTSHNQSSIAAAGQPQAATPDPSVQAAALPPQLSTAPQAAPAGASIVTAATGAAVPVSGLAVEIAASAQSGKTRFEVRLDPADLGRIDVRIDVDRNGQVTSHLTVEKPETLSMLQQDAPQLQQALNDAGLKTGGGGLQFSLRDQSSSGQNSGNQTPNNAQRLIVNDESTVPATVAGQSYGRMLGSSGGVDIRV